MNTNQSLPNQFVLISSGKSATNFLLRAAIKYAAHTPIYLLDGNWRTSPFYLSMELNLETEQPNEIYANIDHIQMFTCDQWEKTLEGFIKGTRSKKPVFALDFLSAFYRESVPLKEARRSLEYCILYLKLISRVHPVLVTVNLPLDLLSERKAFYDKLKDGADQLIGENG